MERKKSPLVGNENRSPTPTVIRIPPQLNKPYMTPKIGLSKYHNNDNNNKNNSIASPDSKSLEKALAQEEKKPFNSYLKEHNKSKEDQCEEILINLDPCIHSSNSSEDEVKSSQTSTEDLEKEPFEETTQAYRDIISVPSITGEDELTTNETTFLSQSF
ncbi:unnamed protein product [Lepeophtheirus salmonis]|uniref:(salmon louse) hypothetical protein n=1 Tax=Lepeophtheirus salmonis TaxID=72036 RepID=A0A7R8CAW0_LEPSM|nr:unnamed protein product [Lepeophtheirus salmonis]CAF2755202.1 unnamed protein product [Lepeophtheirus salmonis]